MVTPSSVLAWRIPWTEKPGGYSPQDHKESDTTEATQHTCNFTCPSAGKESSCNVGDPGLIPGLGRSPGEGHGNPLQYSCLENPWTEEPGGPQSIGLQRIGRD